MQKIRHTTLDALSADGILIQTIGKDLILAGAASDWKTALKKSRASLP